VCLNAAKKRIYLGLSHTKPHPAFAVKHSLPLGVGKGTKKLFHWLLKTNIKQRSVIPAKAGI
jgi:hypothetical protein